MKNNSLLAGLVAFASAISYGVAQDKNYVETISPEDIREVQYDGSIVGTKSDGSAQEVMYANHTLGQAEEYVKSIDLWENPGFRSYSEIHDAAERKGDCLDKAVAAAAQVVVNKRNPHPDTVLFVTGKDIYDFDKDGDRSDMITHAFYVCNTPEGYRLLGRGSRVSNAYDSIDEAIANVNKTLPMEHYTHFAVAKLGQFGNWVTGKNLPDFTISGEDYVPVEDS